MTNVLVAPSKTAQAKPKFALAHVEDGYAASACLCRQREFSNTVE